MSLNCLACQRLRRTDSDREWENNNNSNKPHFRNMCCLNVERSWSGNLSPHPYEPIASISREPLVLPGAAGSSSTSAAANIGMIKKGRHHHHHRRMHSTGTLAFGDQPKLVRSSGMRRDWSFEDLHKRGGDRTTTTTTTTAADFRQR